MKKKNNKKTYASPRPIFGDYASTEDEQFPIHLVDYAPPNGESDYSIVRVFLNQFEKSPQTFNSYRRDIERLMQWSWEEKPGTGILELDPDDLTEFFKFLKRVPVRWIGKSNVARFSGLDEAGWPKINPKWRPFVNRPPKATYLPNRVDNSVDKPIINNSKYVLSEASKAACLRSLSAFYDRQRKRGDVQKNPVDGMSKNQQMTAGKSRTKSSKNIRRLSATQWKYVIETARLMAKDDPIHERTLFIVTALFMLYLRVSELAGLRDDEPPPTMGDIYIDSNDLWWISVVGKGDKQRNVPLPDAMLEALKRYRIHRELSPLPYKGETTPLIPSNRSPKTGLKSTRAITYIVQECFDKALDRIGSDSENQADKDALKIATVHWLRHTGISVDVNRGRPRVHVRDKAGHSGMATTDGYSNEETKRQHESGQDMPLTDI